MAMRNWELKTPSIVPAHQLARRQEFSTHSGEQGKMFQFHCYSRGLVSRTRSVRTAMSRPIHCWQKPH